MLSSSRVITEAVNHGGRPTLQLRGNKCELSYSRRHTSRSRVSNKLQFKRVRMEIKAETLLNRICTCFQVQISAHKDQQ